jgi:hypothetical protein
MAQRRYRKLFSAERMGRETRAIFEATFAAHRQPLAPAMVPALVPASPAVAVPGAPLGLPAWRSFSPAQAAD